MPIRSQALTEKQLLDELFRRVKTVEDIVRRRALPVGYEARQIDGLLTFVNTATGATQTLDI